MVRFFNRAQPVEAPVAEPAIAPVEPENGVGATEKKDAFAGANGDFSDSDAISVDAQEGVRDIEAMTKAWPRSHLILAYVL
jgi:hypothetical protein